MASMSDCKEVQALLSEYVDGAVAAEKAWDMKMHLASCAVCALAAQELASVASMLGSMPRRNAPDSFEEALTRRLVNQVLQPRRLTLGERIGTWWALPRVRPALATAGALAALMPAILIFAGRRGAEPAAPSAAAADQQFVQQCLEEHTSYVSAEPLGDQAATILSASSKLPDGKTREVPVEESL